MTLPRVGVGLLVRRGDDVLLIRRHGAHGSGEWSTPGGNLDFAEDPRACAVREAREETTVETGTPRFIGITNDVFAREAEHYVTLWFEAEYRSGQPSASVSGELTEVGWFAQSALPQPLFPPFARLLAGEVVA